MTAPCAIAVLATATKPNANAAATPKRNNLRITILLSSLRMESHTDEPGLWIWFSGICCERGGPSELFHRCGARRWLKHANASERRWRLTKSYPCASGEDADKIRWTGLRPNDKGLGSSLFASTLLCKACFVDPVPKC